jgi:hypothetical protein
LDIKLHTPDVMRRSKPRKAVTERGPCASSESAIDQEINNVRARLLGGGDVWWDFNDGRYIVPKVDVSTGAREVSSIFAGSVWLGGLDPAGNLKLACQDYRPGGQNDFWPGPLNPNDGTTDEATCKEWDRHFRVTGDEIRQHLNNIASGLNDPALIPRGVKGWPARGNPYFAEVWQFSLPNTSQGLAGFYDAPTGQIGVYNPLDGDYPSIEIRGCELDRYPAEMIFWIYNDEGSGAPHARTKSETPIQMEVQVQAFAYQTADELNDMTFQRYKLINRASDLIDSTYFAMWVDADLGCFQDDYIGCDTINDLMYTYNQDAVDGTTGCDCPSGNGNVPSYCDQVPILGVDYFRGPRKSVIKRDSITGNPVIDPETGEPIEVLEEIGMSSFMYYNNPGVGTPDPATTDPNQPGEFYNYLTGTWADQEPLTIGGTGYSPGSPNAIPTKYALASPPNDPTGWSMCTANLPFGDRRTLQASGPFLLKPGAVNELIIGIPWVPNISYPCPDVEQLLRADKLAQGLFDNCFERLEGPDAPQVGWVELDQEVVAALTNDVKSSNNFNEEYRQADFLAPNDVKGTPAADYVFEGYKIFQLVNGTVSTSDYDDPDQARLVAQVDVKNNVSRIFNWEETIDPLDPENPTKKEYYPVEQVAGANEGIRHTFSFKEDAFATGNARQLINHRKYYYSVVAYAYNNYGNFDETIRPVTGQQKPYLEGGRVEVFTVIPRPIVDRVLNAAYGDGVVITRVEGEGAGGNFLDVSNEMREKMIASNFNGEITYEPGEGPLDILIFNPFEVSDGEYELRFVDGNLTDTKLDDTARWELRQLPSGGLIKSAKTIAEINEQIVTEYGFSVNIAQSAEPGNATPALRNTNILAPGANNGFLGQETVYENPDEGWIGGVQDQQIGFFNYVRTDKTETDFLLDPENGWGTQSNAWFVPYGLASHDLTFGPIAPGGANRFLTPAWTGKIAGQYGNGTPNCLGSLDPSSANNRFEKINATPNVDIVLTADKSKWSRCVVIETASEYYFGSLAGVVKNPAYTPESASDRVRQSFDVRFAPSVGKNDTNGDGLPDPDGELEPTTLPSGAANPRANQQVLGMGWFPGYAVNVETGQRLNVFFGENSVYSKSVNPAFTGRDMLFNPTNQIFDNDEGNVTEISNLLFGGQHMVYVSNTPYDSCKFIRWKLTPEFFSSQLKNIRKTDEIKLLAWAGMLALAPTYQMDALGSGGTGLIPYETVFKLRVDNKYGIAKEAGNGHPTYRFRINGRQSQVLSTDQVENALDSIKVVPNPYYGYSQYENSVTSNVVKITNLPAKCVVTIYSLDGRFIRQYRRDEVYERYSQITPALEWDLKNNKAIPVASGVYLIHVDADELGERTLKWFGIARMFDPSGL